MIKILLIEDNIEMRENTAEILELADYEVQTAENGKVGVKMAIKEQPDIVVCDIMMPEMDGYEVLYLLSKKPATSGIPFIFLTAKADKVDIRKGMELGADDYLTKPYDEMQLLNAIEVRLKKSEAFRREYENNEEGLNSFIDEAKGLSELEKLSEERDAKSYQRKMELFTEGDRPHFLMFIKSGKVKTWLMNEDGKELITGLLKEGDFLGYMAILREETYRENATALEDTEVILIPRDDFSELLHKNRDVSHRFIKMLSNKVMEEEERLLHLAYSPVRERVAEALLLLQKRYGEENGGNFSMKISRDDLAGIVGTATESLIRTLSDLKEESLIEVNGREITIVNGKGLEKVANPFSF